MARRGNRRGYTKLGTASRSQRTGRPHGECAVSTLWGVRAHRHGWAQLGVVLVVHLERGTVSVTAARCVSAEPECAVIVRGSVCAMACIRGDGSLKHGLKALIVVAAE